MDVETSIFAALVAANTTAGNRVYPMRRPQATPVPAVTFQRVGSAPVNGLDGSLGVDQVRVQVDCWAAGDVAGYKAAKTLARAVRVAMETIVGVRALFVDEGDEYEPDTDLYRVRMDFSVWAPR